jgi:hypothetical protein
MTAVSRAEVHVGDGPAARHQHGRADDLPLDPLPQFGSPGHVELSPGLATSALKSRVVHVGEPAGSFGGPNPPGNARH